MIETEKEKLERKQHMERHVRENYVKRMIEMNQEIAEDCGIDGFFTKDTIGDLLSFDILSIEIRLGEAKTSWTVKDLASHAEDSSYDKKNWALTWYDEVNINEMEVMIKAPGLEVLREAVNDLIDPDMRPRANARQFETLSTVITEIIGESILEYMKDGFAPDGEPFVESDLYEPFIEFVKTESDLHLECYGNVCMTYDEVEDQWSLDFIY